MPCNPLTDADGKLIGWACGPGRYTHLVMAGCPFCCLGEDQTINAFREVYGGWESPDLICGTCGQPWSPEYGLAKVTEEGREENRALVSEMRAAGVEVGDWPSPSALEVDRG